MRKQLITVSTCSTILLLSASIACAGPAQNGRLGKAASEQAIILAKNTGNKNQDDPPPPRQAQPARPPVQQYFHRGQRHDAPDQQHEGGRRQQGDNGNQNTKASRPTFSAPFQGGGERTPATTSVGAPPPPTPGRLQITPQESPKAADKNRGNQEKANTASGETSGPGNQAPVNANSVPPSSAGRLQIEPAKAGGTPPSRNAAKPTAPSNKPQEGPARLITQPAPNSVAPKPPESARLPVQPTPARPITPTTQPTAAGSPNPPPPTAVAATNPTGSATFSKPDQNLSFKIPVEGQTFRAVGDDMRSTLYIVKDGQLQSIGGQKYVANTDFRGPNGELVKAGQEVPTNRLDEAGYRPASSNFTGAWTSTTQAGTLYDQKNGAGSYDKLPTYNIADVNTAIQKIGQYGGRYPTAGQTFTVPEDQAIKGYTNPNVALQIPSPPPPAPPQAPAPSNSSAGTGASSPPTYTFSQTGYGTIGVFEDGNRIGTTTPQNAAQNYGYIGTASSNASISGGSFSPAVPIYPQGMAPAPRAAPVASHSGSAASSSGQQDAEALRQRLVSQGVAPADIEKTMQAYYGGMETNSPTAPNRATTSITPATSSIQQDAETLRRQLVSNGVPQSEINRTLQAYYEGQGVTPPVASASPLVKSEIPLSQSNFLTPSSAAPFVGGMANSTPALPACSPSCPPGPNMDQVQLGLTSAGFIQGPVGTAADVVNAGISAARGKPGEALFDIASAIPVAGDLFAGTKLVAKGTALARTTTAVRDAASLREVSKDMGAFLKYSEKITENLRFPAHAVRDHVGKTADELKQRIKDEGIDRASTFSTPAEQAAAVSKAIADKKDYIEQQMAQGAKQIQFDTSWSGGTVITRNSDVAQSGNKVWVYLKQLDSGEYIVQTAYPTL